MNNDFKSLPFVFWLVACTAIFVLSGIGYWIKNGADGPRCLWGNSECSLTVATYVLAFVTALAFIAAFQAAWFAFRTFEVAREGLQLERTAILSVRRCKDGDHYSDTNIILEPTKQIAERDPSDEEKAFFYEMAYDFTSLGRIPVVDIKINVEVIFSRRNGMSEGQTVSKLVSIGSLKSDGEAHVCVWVAPELLDIASLFWSSSNTTSQPNADLRFHAATPERPEFRAMIRYDHAGNPPLPEPVPIPIPIRTTPTE